MQLYTQLVGLEHLQTGLEIVADSNVTFEKDGPTIFKVWSHQPFKLNWTVVADDGRTRTITLAATREDYEPRSYMPYTMNQVREHVAHNDRLKG